MLETRSVRYAVGSRRLVEDVTLRLEPGRLIAIVGPNGAGKSTLLRLLSGELRPTDGDVLLDGRGLQQFSAAELACRRAVVSQQSALSFPFTVLEVVLLGATVPGFGAADRLSISAARTAISRVGLASFADRFFTELSGGEQRRVQVARALCQLAVAPARPGNSCTLLLDEPTANLDLAHQGLILAEARREAENGRAVLAILHDLNLAAAYADAVVVMSNGRVMAAGSPAETLSPDLLSDVFGCAIQSITAGGFVRPVFVPVWRST